MPDYSARYAAADPFIEYIKVGGSYQAVNDYAYQTDLRPASDIITERLHLLKNGMFYMLSGYCWDGMSGPVIDRKTNMRAGGTHDGLYHLCRMRLIPFDWWPRLDRECEKILKKDGAWKITRKIDMLGLKLARGKYAHPDARKKRYQTKRASPWTKK